MTATITDSKKRLDKEWLPQVDFVTRQLARKYPDHSEVEIETAVLLAVLEAGDFQDREHIRALAGKLLSDGGIDAACAIAGTYGIEAISRKVSGPGSSPAGGITLFAAGCRPFV